MGGPAGECLESDDRVSVVGRLDKSIQDWLKALRRGDAGADGGHGAWVKASVDTGAVRARSGSSGDADAANAVDGVEVFGGPHGTRVLALPEAAERSRASGSGGNGYALDTACDG